MFGELFGEVIKAGAQQNPITYMYIEKRSQRLWTHVTAMNIWFKAIFRKQNATGFADEVKAAGNQGNRVGYTSSVLT
jgi:hypothetical protein